MEAYKLQPAVLAKHFSITATFFLKRTVIVDVVDRPDIVAYTEFPDKDAPLRILISYTSDIYRDAEGNALPDDVKAYLMYGALTHEILHQIYTPFDSIKLEKKRVIHDILFLDVVNVVEDCAIESASPAIFGGTMLEALAALIRHLYQIAHPIDFGVPVGDTKWAVDQIMNALIIIGDRGTLKGTFLTEEAKAAYEEILPIWNEAVKECSGDRRVILSRRIYNIIEPLIEKPYEQKVEHANQGTDGDGQPLPQYNDYDLNKAKKEKSDDAQTVKGTRTPEPEETESDAESDSKSESGNEKSEENGQHGNIAKENDGQDASEPAGDAQEGSEGDSAVNDADGGEKPRKAPSGASEETDIEKESEADETQTGSVSDESDDFESDQSEPENNETSGQSKESDGNGSAEDGIGDSGTDSEGKSNSGADKAGRVENETRSNPIDEESKKRFEDEVAETAKKIAEEDERERTETEARDSDIPGSSKSSNNSRVEFRHDDADEYAALSERNSTRIAVLTRNLKRVFRSDSNGRKYDTHGSRIEPRRLSDGKMHTRIMMNRNAPKDLRNMAIQILVDESYSMHGEKIENARDCCVTLYEAMERLGIPISVTGFSTEGMSADNRHYVTWHKSRNDKLALAQISARRSNLDWLSIRDATTMLGKCDAKHKLMIVLSDGQPCPLVGMTSYEAQMETKKAIENARKNGISVVGVAIEAGNEMVYADMYGRNFITVSNVEQMTQEVCTAIAGAIASW